MLCPIVQKNGQGAGESSLVPRLPPSAHMCMEGGRSLGTRLGESTPRHIPKAGMCEMKSVHDYKPRY